MTAIDHKGSRICYVDAEGLNVIRKKAKKWGYAINKIEVCDNRFGYVVTMEKVKKLRHYDPIKQ
jgi:hypothetical protein